MDEIPDHERHWFNPAFRALLYRPTAVERWLLRRWKVLRGACWLVGHGIVMHPVHGWHCPGCGKLWLWRKDRFVSAGWIGDGKRSSP
jgi:hypothetical protein